MHRKGIRHCLHRSSIWTPRLIIMEPKRNQNGQQRQSSLSVKVLGLASKDSLHGPQRRLTRTQMALTMRATMSPEPWLGRPNNQQSIDTTSHTNISTSPIGAAIT